jgi:uncharacterized protein YegJ (DUF2314 family)
VKPNARRTTIVTLARNEPQKGDARNRLVGIVFPGPSRDLQIRQTAMVDELFGSHDALKWVGHDAATLAASARARAALLAHKARYRNGPPFGEQLLVKAPFPTPGGRNEWMWLEVVRWEGSTLHGILQNDPFEIPGLKAGARVEAQEDSLFDYLLTHPDGKREGNETSKLLKAQP